MINRLKAEMLKFKNSFGMYVLLYSPLLFLIFAVFTAVFAQSQPDTPNHLSPYLILLFNLWPLIFIPIIIGLSCYSFVSIETRNNMFDFYKSNSWSISKTIKSKIWIIVFGLFFHCILMFLVALIGNKIVGNYHVNPLLILSTILMIFLLSVPLVPINFLLARYVNIFVLIGINIMISVLCIIMITLKKWFWILPWASIQRVPLITMGILPNGTSISTNRSHYFNDLNSLLIALIASGVYYVLFYYLNNTKSWRLS